MVYRVRWLVTLAALVAATPLISLAVSDTESASADIQLQLGNLLFSEGRYEEALEAYGHARQAPQKEQRLKASSGYIRSALRVAEFARAREEALTLRRAAPQSADALALYGDAQWATGLFDEAESAFNDALALDSSLARGHHGIARALAARSQLPAAMDEAQAALGLAPRDGEIYHTVGSIYERMHRFEEAAIAFGNYVNLLPNKDRSEKAAWSRAEIRFLRAFGRKLPYEIEGDAPDMLHTVRFKLVRDKVVVQGTINNGQQMDFVLDTGAEQTVVSRRVAQRSGVVPIVYTLSAGVGDIGLRGLQVGKIDLLQIGTLRIRNVPCLIKNPPLGGLPTKEAESFSPLSLGLSMVIDYKRRELTIGRRVVDEPAQIELPMRLHRLAMVRGLVNRDYPANFVIDTGGEVISISAATAEAIPKRSNARRIPLKVYGTSGWDREAFLMPGVDLAFDRILFPNFPVVVLNLQAPSALLGFQLGGIVGHKFLSRYRVQIDLDRSVVKLRES